MLWDLIMLPLLGQNLMKLRIVYNLFILFPLKKTQAWSTLEKLYQHSYVEVRVGGEREEIEKHTPD